MYFEKVFPLNMLFIRELSHFITRVLHFEVDKLVELMGLKKYSELQLVDFDKSGRRFLSIWLGRFV